MSAPTHVSVRSLVRYARPASPVGQSSHTRLFAIVPDTIVRSTEHADMPKEILCVGTCNLAKLALKLWQRMHHPNQTLSQWLRSLFHTEPLKIHFRPLFQGNSLSQVTLATSTWGLVVSTLTFHLPCWMTSLSLLNGTGMNPSIWILLSISPTPMSCTSIA